MNPRSWLTAAVGALAAAWPATAEITALSGSASAAVQELRSGAETGRDEASDSFPQTSAALPLQVVARLTALDAEAGAAAAAQLADPLTATTVNPEDFALHLVLSSLDPDIHYTATASAEERRTVRLRPAEVRADDGATVELTGRVYVDGVLALFARAPVAELASAYLKLHVTVTRLAADAEPEVVFDGRLWMAGAAEDGPEVTVEGDFPAGGVIVSDLSAVPDAPAVFDVVVLPNLVLEYPYTAVVGAEFTLQAVFTLEAAGAPGGVGVIGLLGAPSGAVDDVLDLVRGRAAAAGLRSALAAERAAPSGRPLRPAAAGPLGACGLLGLEAALVPAGLAGLRAGRRIGRAGRR